MKTSAQNGKPSASLTITFWRTALLSLVLITMVGCAARMNRDEGLRLIQEGRYEDGLAKLTEANQNDPKDATYRAEYLRQRDLIVSRLIASASTARTSGKPDVAATLYRRALGIEAQNERAKAGLLEIETERRHAQLLEEARGLQKKGDAAGALSRLAVIGVENPGHVKANELRHQITDKSQVSQLAGPTLNIMGRKPVTLQFRDSNLKVVLEAIARTANLNIIIDKDVRNDLKVSLFVKDSPVEETLDLLLIQSQLEKRLMGDNTILVYPNTPAKVKEYQELKVRRFQLANADPKQVQSMLKTLLKIKDVFIDERAAAVMVRDTPNVIRLAESLVESMDGAEPEVMLEVEVLEVTRNPVTDMGLDWPTSFSVAYPATGVALSALSVNRDTLKAQNDLKWTLKLNTNTSDVNLLASPRIRVRNKEKAKIHIGDRLPVITNSVTPTTTGATIVAGNVQYLDVGLKLEVEPTIHLDGDVAIKVSLEVSTAGAVINTATGTQAYPVGTRMTSTLLQLKDGETQILAGLLSDEDRSSGNHIPGIGAVPILGRLFGSTHEDVKKTEIILSITPRIVRNVQTYDANALEHWSGTDASIKNGQMQLKVAGSAGIITPGASAQPGRPGPIQALPLPTPTPATPAAPAPLKALPEGDFAVSMEAPAQAQIGEKFTVRVNAQTAQMINSTGWTLAFDPKVLKPVSVTEGDFIKRSSQQTIFDSQIDQNAGQISVTMAPTSTDVVTGAGALASIQFEAIASGSSQLTLSSVLATGTGEAPIPTRPAAPLTVTVP